MASTATGPEPVLDQQPQQQEEHGVKRRQSEEPDEATDSKRQRTSPGKNSPTATRDSAAKELGSNEAAAQEQKPVSTDNARRKSDALDEKQRSKRLFGALLGNLRQPGDRTSKKRQEIETRKLTELRRQDDERLEDRQKRQEQLAEQRKITQRAVDEKNMRRRHRATVDKANYLQTKAEPRLLYRPWELREDEEDLIDDQIKDARKLVDEELAAFREHQGREASSAHDQRNGEADKKDAISRLEVDAKQNLLELPASGEATLGQSHEQAKSDESGGPAATNDSAGDVPSANHPSTDAGKGEDKGRPPSRAEDGDGDDDGEHVQEGDEDAAIY